MSKKQSGQKKSLIQLQPMQQSIAQVAKPPPIDYMRFTQQNPVFDQYNEYSQTSQQSAYEAISSASYGDVVSPLVNVARHNTHRPLGGSLIPNSGPSARVDLFPRQQKSGRPNAQHSRPFDQDDIEKILQQNNDYNFKFHNGVSLYSIETPKTVMQEQYLNSSQSSGSRSPVQFRADSAGERVYEPNNPRELQKYDKISHQRSQTLGGGSFTKKAMDKIQILNAQQQAEARKQLQTTSFDMGVTYKNLDVREDFQETFMKSNTGPRFSEQLMGQKSRSKSRSGSPERFHVPPTYQSKIQFKETDEPQNKKSDMIPTPDDKILKPENFIQRLLAASENPDVQNKLPGKFRKINEPAVMKFGQRSGSPQEPGLPLAGRAQFEHFMEDYDNALHRELKNRRGLSPEEVRAHKERVDDLKKVEAFIQTIRAQDKELPEYLRAGQKQRDQLEMKFKDARKPYHLQAPSGNRPPVTTALSGDELSKSREATQDVKILSNGFDMKELIPKSVDLSDQSLTKMLRTSQGFFRPEIDEIEEASPPRQASVDYSIPPDGKNRFDQVQRTHLEGTGGQTVKILNKRIRSPESKTRNLELDQSQIDLNDRANLTALEIPETTMMKKDIKQIMECESQLRPVSPQQALREYQIFKNFEDPEFYNEASNIDKIVEELDKMDKFASIKWDDKVLGPNQNVVVDENKNNEKPPLSDKVKASLKTPPQPEAKKAENPATSWSSDPELILKQGLKNQTLMADEIQRCLEHQKGLEETRVRIDTEMKEGVKSPSDRGSTSQSKSVITKSRQNRQSIVQSFEQSQMVKLEAEKAAQIQAQALRQKFEIEQARTRASEQQQEQQKKSQHKSYSSVPVGEMSDELRMKTAFSQKLLKLLYSN